MSPCELQGLVKEEKYVLKGIDRNRFSQNMDVEMFAVT